MDATVDTTGLLLVVMVIATNRQDQVAARELLSRLHTTYPSVQHVWADGGDQNKGILA